MSKFILDRFYDEICNEAGKYNTALSIGEILHKLPQHMAEKLYEEIKNTGKFEMVNPSKLPGWGLWTREDHCFYKGQNISVQLEFIKENNNFLKGFTIKFPYNSEKQYQAIDELLKTINMDKFNKKDNKISSKDFLFPQDEKQMKDLLTDLFEKLNGNELIKTKEEIRTEFYKELRQILLNCKKVKFLTENAEEEGLKFELQKKIYILQVSNHNDNKAHCGGWFGFYDEENPITECQLKEEGVWEGIEINNVDDYRSNEDGFIEILGMVDNPEKRRTVLTEISDYIISKIQKLS